MSNPETSGRFLTLDELSDELNISRAQAYALVRSGELSAIKIGGRGQWRVERSALEDYITHAYQATAQHVKDHPLDPPPSRTANPTREWARTALIAPVIAATQLRRQHQVCPRADSGGGLTRRPELWLHPTN